METITDAIVRALGCTSIDRRSLKRVQESAYQIAVFVEDSEEMRLLRQRIEDAEIALNTWDNGRNSEYWLRHPSTISNGEC